MWKYRVQTTLSMKCLDIFLQADAPSPYFLTRFTLSDIHLASLLHSLAVRLIQCLPADYLDLVMHRPGHCTPSLIWSLLQQRFGLNDI